MHPKITQYLEDLFKLTISSDITEMFRNARMCIQVREIHGNRRFFVKPYVKLEVGIKDQRNDQWMATFATITLGINDSVYIDGDMIQLDPTKIIKLRREGSE